MTDDALTAALDYAAHGWAVLPCSARTKAPLPKHGHHDASTDVAQLVDWWIAWPDALIGAAVPDELLVLDLDPRNGGSLEQLQQVLGELPETLTCWSGRNDGGRHLYFLRPRGELSRHRLPSGVDLKIHGYMIMPPSPHPATGLPYRWERRAAARLSRYAVEALRPAERRIIAGSGVGNGATLVATITSAPHGKRNDLLFWAARRAVEEGHPDLLDALVQAAAKVGLEPREVERTISSALRGAR